MSRTVKADAVSKCAEVCRMTNRRRTRTLIPGETLHVPEHLFMKIHIEALQKFNSWGVTPWHRCTRSFVLTKSFVKLHGPWRSLSIVSMHQLRFCYFRDLDWHPVRALHLIFCMPLFRSRPTVFVMCLGLWWFSYQVCCCAWCLLFCKLLAKMDEVRAARVNHWLHWPCCGIAVNLGGETLRRKTRQDTFATVCRLCSALYSFS